MSVPRATAAPESVGATARVSPAGQVKRHQHGVGFPPARGAGALPHFVHAGEWMLRKNILKHKNLHLCQIFIMSF